MVFRLENLADALPRRVVYVSAVGNVFELAGLSGSIFEEWKEKSTDGGFADTRAPVWEGDG